MRTPVNIVRIDKRLGCPKGYFGFRVEDKSVFDKDGKNGPTVVVFDMRYPMHGEEGQRVSSYFIDTLMEDWPTERGLILDGGNRDSWTMTPEEFGAMMRRIAVFTTAEGDHKTILELEDEFRRNMDWPRIPSEPMFSEWLRHEVSEGRLQRGWK